MLLLILRRKWRRWVKDGVVEAERTFQKANKRGECCRSR